MTDMKPLMCLILLAVAKGYSVGEDSPECEDGEQEASLVDPQQFFRCVFGFWVTMFCDEGWEYNPSYEACQVEPTTAVDHSIPEHSNCEPPSPCPDGKYLQDDCNCHKFYQCDHGGAVHKECGPGTAFNPKICVCDWPYNVELCKTLGQL